MALSNRLTGEAFGPGAGTAPISSAGLRRLEAGGATRFPEKPGQLRQAENLAEITTAWPSPNGAAQAQMSTRFEVEPRTGDLLITQSGEARERGLCGIMWGLGEIPDDFEVLVPGNSGQRFGKDAPQGRREFDYPMGWEAPFVLIQGKQGGFIVRAEAPAYRFKNLSVERSRRFFRLWFESRNPAPFEDKGRIESSRWRLTAYRGPWQAGAAIYRGWAEQQHAPTPLEQKEPAWVRDIRFVVIMNLDRPLLKALATRCRPPQTLLYLPNWRKDEYDRNYPDYTAATGFGPFVEEAHRLGFRVMPHVNYFGCDPKHPLYARFKQWQVRDPFTKELQWWDWPYADPPIKFAYINPASRAWRELFVQRMADLRRQFPVDALHLDQTLCIYNDANGPIDGLNCIAGNLALHRDLRRALPEVALSGEGLNEVTCREEAFAQRHVWGMDHVHGTWDDRYIAMSHPVSSSVLSGSTHIYGYLGMPNPDTTSSATAWARAYEHFGVLPTYPWPDAAQLEKPSSPVTQLLDRARFFQEFRPVPDFGQPWQDNDLFVYRLADGEPGGVSPRPGRAVRAPGPRPADDGAFPAHRRGERSHPARLSARLACLRREPHFRARPTPLLRLVPCPTRPTGAAPQPAPGGLFGGTQRVAPRVCQIPYRADRGGRRCRHGPTLGFSGRHHGRRAPERRGHAAIPGMRVRG